MAGDEGDVQKLDLKDFIDHRFDAYSNEMASKIKSA